MVRGNHGVAAAESIHRPKSPGREVERLRRDQGADLPGPRKSLVAARGEQIFRIMRYRDRQRCLKAERHV